MRRIQALAAKAEVDHRLSTHPRQERVVQVDRIPNWRYSGSLQFSYVRCGDDDEPASTVLDRSFDKGCWTWEICMKKMRFTACVGVVAGDIDLSQREYLADAGRFVYDSEGGYWDDGTECPPQAPSFAKGDTIRLTLDCEAGFLSIAVNDGESHTAFSWVKQAEKVQSFRPAVSIMYGGSVRLLSFGRVTATM